MTLRTSIAADMSIPAADLPTSVTYRSKDEGASSVDADTGVVTRGWTDDALTDCFVQEYSLRDVATSGGLLQLGDTRLNCLVGDLTNDPKSTDQFVYNSVTYRVFKWVLEEDMNVWVISGRKA